MNLSTLTVLAQTTAGGGADGGASQTIQETTDDVQKWWENPTTHNFLVEYPIKVLLIILFSAIINWLARRVVDKFTRYNLDNPKLQKINLRGGSKANRKAQKEQLSAIHASQEARRKSRIKTLSAVFKSALAILIWSWAIIMILSVIGLDVTPILASAGVVGLAIGFGAQSLVKDFLSGIFMLVEDQYGVGDTIDVGDGIVGDVEEVSLRLTTLRDIDGTLWYIRNGEILRVGNFSDEFSIARVQIPVALSADTEQAMQIIADAADKAAEDPTISASVLEKPVMNGATSLEADHISYRISVKTLPGQQWEVQRRLYTTILAAMQRAGIRTPYPDGIGIPTTLRQDES